MRSLGLNLILRRTQRLKDENDRLKAEARRYYHADGTFEELESPEAVVQARIAAAKLIERQRQIIEDPKIVEMELEPGGAVRMDLEPCIGAKVLAASFADMIGKAPNWASVVIGPMPSDQGRLIVTVRRFEGMPPEAMVAWAKKIIADLIQHIENGDRPEAISDARRFVDPA